MVLIRVLITLYMFCSSGLIQCQVLTRVSSIAVIHFSAFGGVFGEFVFSCPPVANGTGAGAMFNGVNGDMVAGASSPANVSIIGTVRSFSYVLCKYHSFKCLPA